jgi:hypothetical protein
MCRRRIVPYIKASPCPSKRMGEPPKEVELVSIALKAHETCLKVFILWQREDADEMTGMRAVPFDNSL